MPYTLALTELVDRQSGTGNGESASFDPSDSEVLVFFVETWGEQVSSQPAFSFYLQESFSGDVADFVDIEAFGGTWGGSSSQSKSINRYIVHGPFSEDLRVRWQDNQTGDQLEFAVHVIGR